VAQQPVVEKPDAEGETALIDMGRETAGGLERARMVGQVRCRTGVRMRRHVSPLGREVCLQLARHLRHPVQQRCAILVRLQRLPKSSHPVDQVLVLPVDLIDTDPVLG
jgi:hypothetical protein